MFGTKARGVRGTFFSRKCLGGGREGAGGFWTGDDGLNELLEFEFASEGGALPPTGESERGGGWEGFGGGFTLSSDTTMVGRL